MFQGISILCCVKRYELCCNNPSETKFPSVTKFQKSFINIHQFKTSTLSLPPTTHCHYSIQYKPKYNLVSLDDGAEVSMSVGLRISRAPVLVPPKTCTASESTFEKSNTCGVSNTRLYF